MANYKVAYGKRDNMNTAIELGVIPPGCIILTEDSHEIFFYDLEKEIRAYEERYKFDTYDEAADWVRHNDCKGQIFSVHEDDKCNLYVVGYDNQLHSITTNYIIEDKDPTELDDDHDTLTYWINANTEDVYILVSVSPQQAHWKLVTSSGDKSYKFTQSIASDNWIIEHNLKKYPSVFVKSLDGESVVGEVNYIDESVLYIRFTSPISGYAYLN